MRIAFFVNDVDTELDVYSTTRLAHAAARRGWDVWYVGVEDFAFGPDGKVVARGQTAPAGSSWDDHEEYLRALQQRGTRRRIDVADLDVLMLRNDPAADQADRPWAQSTGILFGHAASLRGVTVLNDPAGLSLALNKMYLSHFPEWVRPATLITRDRDEIRGFVHAHPGGTILKPLRGSGGESVFLVPDGEHGNLNQIIDAVRRLGYVIAQEYLPAAAERDTRLFLLNGRLLEVDGKYCAFSRIGSDGDIRTNMTAGGTAAAAEVTPRMLELAGAVGSRLEADGMFLVGLDIAGECIMEINVFSPGGLGSAQHFMGVDFTGAVLDAVEREVAARRESDTRTGTLV